MPGTGHFTTAGNVLLQYRIILRFSERAQRLPGNSITYSIILPSEEVGRVHHIDFVVVMKGKRSFGPAAVYFPAGDRATLPLCLRIAHCRGWLQEQYRFTNHSGEIVRNLHAIDPALLNLIKQFLCAGPVCHLTLHRVLVTTA